jgi:hypothetical protein
MHHAVRSPSEPVLVNTTQRATIYKTRNQDSDKTRLAHDEARQILPNPYSICHLWSLSIFYHTFLFEPIIDNIESCQAGERDGLWEKTGLQETVHEISRAWRISYATTLPFSLSLSSLLVLHSIFIRPGKLAAVLLPSSACTILHSACCKRGRSISAFRGSGDAI